MCGDLEEEDTEAERLYAVFLQAAHTAVHEAIDHRGGSRARLEERSDDQGGAIPDAALHSYMDGLFGDILNACIKDGRKAGDTDAYRVLAAQSVVLARLAGFVARHLDLREDPLRNSIDALMAGYGAENSEHTHD
jgi:hypothetical protein